MDNNKAFYTSATIAISLYIFIVIIFLLYLTVHDVKKIDAYSKETILELDIIVAPKKKALPKPVKSHQVKIESKIAKKIVKKSASVSAKKRTDLKSLFANVKTKAKVVKKKIVNNVKKSTTTSRFKSKFEKQTKVDNKLSKLLKEQTSTATLKKKSGDIKNEKDPYISKIYEILYQRWNPLLLLDGLSAKVVLTINYNGELKYRILQYSGDSSFDDQLVIFLEEQSTLKFPIPNKQKIDIEVIFTAKG